tara:strand:+ start:549 stop:689 length:141 start_codon:yes stop_codon:yes gene_type:complete
MLFEFNKVWKTLAIVLVAWGVFAAAGFEFTTVTLLATLVGVQLTKK